MKKKKNIITPYSLEVQIQRVCCNRHNGRGGLGAVVALSSWIVVWCVCCAPFYYYYHRHHRGYYCVSVAAYRSRSGYGRNSFFPQISIGMSAGGDTNNNGYGGAGRGLGGMGRLRGLEPILRWTGEVDVGGSGLLEGGLIVKVEDLDSLPYNVYGAYTQRVGGGGGRNTMNNNGGDWDVSARVDSTSNDMRRWGVHVQLTGETTSVQAQGYVHTYRSSRRNVAVETIKVSQRIFSRNGVAGNSGFGIWTIIPRYHLPTRQGDVTIHYALDDHTMVGLDASLDKQTFTVARRINAEGDMIRNTISTDRELEVEYRRELGYGGSLSTIYKRDDSLSLLWEDGPWRAQLVAPMEGLYTFRDGVGGVKVSVRRNIDFYND